MAIPNWLYLSQLSGTSGVTTIIISANTTNSSRTSELIVSTNHKSANVEINQYPFGYDKYLTFEIVSGGSIYWKYYQSNSDVSTKKPIYYSKDNGVNWTLIAPSTGSSTAPQIMVNAGDTVIFKGNNTSYATATSYNKFSGSTNVRYNVYGNIMSLLYGDDFETHTELIDEYSFYVLFSSNNVLDASNLYLPSTVLKSDCYAGMFRNCSLLTKAPTLPAPTLVSYCYNNMFNGCNSLNYVRCFATDISATGSVTHWLDDVSATGTFVKASGANWPYGIPTGWTVQEI